MKYPDDIIETAKAACHLPADFVHYEAQVRAIARALWVERLRCAIAADMLISDPEEARATRRAIYSGDAA